MPPSPELTAMAPRILDLEIEVLASILEFVDDESPRTTAAVAEVCKHFQYALELVKYRRLTVKWDLHEQSWVDRKGRPQQEWETVDLLRGLRHLTVCRGCLPEIIVDELDTEAEEPPVSTTIDTSPFGRLESVLRNASNLKTLVWKVGYLPTTDITRSLDTCQPNAKMNIYRSKRLTDASMSLESERTLATSTCLNTLSMTASYGTSIEDHMAFQMIIALAPNLKFASLVSIPPMRPGDLELSSPRAAPERWFPKDRQVWKPNTSITHLTLDGWCLSAETLEHWSKYVDLATLESFKCSRGSIYPSYFQRAPELLTSLKHVSLNLNPHEHEKETAEAIKQYISACRPLSSLSLWSWRGKVPLPTILSQHGTTLNELHLHEREDPWLGLRDAMSLEELQTIGESCPQLKTFTFDLNRVSNQLNVEDYAAVLDELHKFRLENLQIYLDSGVLWLTNAHPIHRYSGTNSNNNQTSDDVGLPGFCDGDSEFGDATPLTINSPNRRGPALPDAAGARTEPILAQPPSTNKDICRFLIKAWKAVFGSHTVGARHLDLKFGEWERKGNPAIWLSRGQRDVRVWCRAKPQERDDSAGACAVEVDCCGGEHKRKFLAPDVEHISEASQRIVGQNDSSVHHRCAT